MKTYFVFIVLFLFFNNQAILGQSTSFFGTYAGGVGTNQYNLQRASAIGYNAKVSVNDGLVLGDTANVKVGIGLSNPQYRLDVKGVFNMRTANNSPSLKINGRNFLELDHEGQFVLNSFKIKYKNPSQWADKVFTPHYPLLSLMEVEAFIKKNNHLPNLPSAQEVVEKGIENDQMMAKLLEKIEELTLYTIQQQKEINLLKQKVRELKN